MKRWSLAFLIVVMPSSAFGQTKIETGSGFDMQVSGMVDLYYLYNQNGYNLKPGADAASTDDDYDTFTFRNYDNTHNDIVLNLFELTLEGEYKFLKFYVDLDFGNFAEQNAPVSEEGVTHQVGQAYLRYSKGPIQVTAGKFYTHVGYESPKAIDNWNFSRSFAYMIGTPTWHEGISIRHDYSNGMHWSLYLYDSFDAQRTDNNNQKSGGLQAGFDGERWSWNYNVLAGNESDRDAAASTQSSLQQIHQSAVQFDMNEQWSFAVSALYAHDEDQGVGANPDDQMWKQAAVYVHHTHNKWSFTARYEWFEFLGELPLSEGGTAVDSDTLSFQSNTLTVSKEVSELSELRLEYRSDQTNEAFYMQDNDSTNLVENQTTYSVAWLMQF